MIKARAYLIFFFMILAFAALVARLYSIQIKQHDKLSLIAIKQQIKPQNVIAERGKIFDRNNELLAYSKNEVSFYVNNRMPKKRIPDEKLAAKFSEVFNKPKSYFLNLLKSGKRRVCLAEKVSKEYISVLKNFKCERLYYEVDNTRFYPYGSNASHIIGYVSKDMTGMNGIERKFDDILKGEDGKIIFEKNAAEEIIGIKEVVKPARDGKNIVLTIDEYYQSILDEELLKGINKFGGEAAVGIILDPNNGEILALSNIPNFDPANYNLFGDENRRNRAISDTYEPGSTIKSIFLSMLFEEKLVSLNEVINTENGKFKLYGRWIRDTHAFDKLTVREVLEHSSNVGIVKLSARINDYKFYKYLRDFGFGNETHIDLPGEVRGRLKKPSKFSKISKAFMAHGYEIAVTPLQMALAYSALVNGGILYKPMIVKKIIDRNGSVEEIFEPQKIRRVISEETSKTIRELMEGVVENGTGENAQLKNISVGGKTGTSHRFINGEYSRTKYNASFIGFFPVEQPQLVCFVWVQSPVKGKFGGQIAAPIFRNVAERIVDSDIRFSKYKHKIERGEVRKDFYTIKLNGEADNIRRHANPQLKTVSSKETTNVKRFTMPNLVGKPLRKALAIISPTGLKLDIRGSGKVMWQSIAPGTKIKPGKKITLKCGR